MDAIVSQILQTKASEQDNLRRYLDTHLYVVKHNASSALSNAIGVLDPTQHTLGLCYLLHSRAQMHPLDSTFANQCENLLDRYNPSVARDHCAEKFCAVVRRYSDFLRIHGQAQRGLLRLRRVIDSFSPGPEFLTPLHADFMLLCLLSKNYKAARALLDRPIFEIDPRKTALTPRDFLLYYYYGARLWVGLQQWGRAHEFALTAITIPATALSAIMVEAFKVFVLSSLASRGKMEPAPKQCSTMVLRHMKKYVPEYIEFGNAYTKREFDKMEELVAKHRDVFVQDHNLGMVEQVMAIYTRQAIQRLTSTYVTLSLTDIADQLRLPSPKEAEGLLLCMVQKGELAASINQRDGMVVFEDSDRPDHLVDGLEDQLLAAQTIIERLLAMDDDMVASREYIMKQILRDPHLRDELEQAIRSGGVKGKMRGMFDHIFKG